ncbi:hypothetical protein ABZ793_06025 [Micromonospora sp. NPDC047465]|uniref:hypothetical protein n=1 Tax=Micromonospora sp. NPDC047465 TaxID=3154813 RepID=UPI0033F35A42
MITLPLLALAVTVVVLLLALATASLLAWAYATAHRDTTADLAGARRDLRTAHRTERELRAELSVLRRLAEQRAVASAALTPDAPARPLMPRWGHQTLRDIYLGKPSDFGTPGGTR